MYHKLKEKIYNSEIVLVVILSIITILLLVVETIGNVSNYLPILLINMIPIGIVFKTTSDEIGNGYHLSLDKIYSTKHKPVIHIFHFLTIVISAVDCAIFDTNTYYFVISAIYLITSIVTYMTALIFAPNTENYEANSLIQERSVSVGEDV